MMSNEQRRLLRTIDEVSFVLDDTVLYLDTHPCDEEAIRHYEKYRDMRDRAVAEYTRRFGPLTANQVDVKNKWTWVMTPWPWEVEGC